MLGESPAPVSISIYRNKQIADRLSISETTVSFHIKNLVEKLGANDRAHAVAIAIRRGLLPV